MTARTRDRIAEVRQAARHGWQLGDIDGALERYDVLAELAAQDYCLFHDALYPDGDRILAEALTLALLPGPAAADPRRARRYAFLAMSHHAGQDHERVGWAADLLRAGDRETALDLVRYLRRSQGPHAAWVLRHPRLAPLAADPEFRAVFAGLDPEAVAARNLAGLQQALGRRPLPDDVRAMLALYWTGQWETEGLLREVRLFDVSEHPFATSLAAPGATDVAHRAVLRHVVPVLRTNDEYLPHRTIGWWLHPDEQLEPPAVLAIGTRPGEYELLGTGCSLAEALVWALHGMEVSWREYMRTHEGTGYDVPDVAVLEAMALWFEHRGVRIRRRRRPPGEVTTHPKVVFDAVLRAELARDPSPSRSWAWFDAPHAPPALPGTVTSVALAIEDGAGARPGGGA